ncbi:MAG: hypothetical protein GJ680_15425 [Alteromonadaceae bacterium]|nr:hypothetical protein [Alteromonadaceae bacterium]
MVLKRLYILCFALACCASASAITLEQALEKAFNANLEYQISLEQIQKAKHTEHIAYSRLYPTLSLSGARNEQLSNNQGAENDTGYQARLQVNQTLYDPSVFNGWKKAELQLAIAELSFLRQKQTLTFSVKQVWYQFLTDIALAQEARESLKRLQQHRKNAQHLYANGSIWRNDLLQADVRVARGEQSLLIAQNAVQRSQTSLNVLLNQNILTSVTAEAEPVDLDWNMGLEDSLLSAVQRRPDLKQQSLSVKIAKKDKSSANATYWPTVTAQITQNNLSDDFEFSDNSRNTQLSINMSWTLWDTMANVSRNKAAHHDVQIALKNESRVKELVQQETHVAWLALQEARQNYAVLQQSMAQAEENFRVTEIRYKEQLSTANDVLDAQDLLTSTRNDLLQARGAFSIARAQLELAIGE